LVVTALFLARYLRTGRAGYGLGFSCVAATIVLLNSTYQWIWLIPVLAIAVIAARKHWRKILPLLLVPFLVVGLWYVKNAVMFGTFTTSSWVGMNLAKLTLFGTSTKNINRLVLQGKLTPLARVPPFNAPYVYIPRFIHVTQHTGVPALDELYDYQTGAPPFIEPSSGGTCCGNEGVLNTNFNNNIYIKLSAKYLHDDIVFIEDEPGLYIHEVGLSLGNWFTPSDQYSFFLPNRQHVQGYVNAYDSFVEWQGHLDLDVYKMTQVEHLAPSPWTLSYQAILASALTLFGLPLLIRRRRGDPVIRGTLGFIWFTVLYATLATSLVELGENNRFRLELGPLPLIGATVIIVAVLRFVSSWWAAKRASVGVPHAAADIQDVRTTQTQPGD